MNSPLSRRTLVVLLALLTATAGVWLAAGTASAQDDGDESGGGLLSLPRADQKRFEKLVNECIQANNRDRYDKAEALCLEAAEITPHPTTWYVRARIYDRTNRCQEAVELYRQVLDTPPAGPAEARFVEEIRDSAQRYADDLGDCSARFELTCEGGDLVVVTGDGDARQVLSGCPIRFSGVGGPQTVTVLAPGGAPTEVTLDGIEGKDVTVALERPPGAPTNGVPTVVTCSSLSEPAVLYVDGQLRGLCGDTLHLPEGTHRIEALATDGAAGLAIAEIAPPAGTEPLTVDVARLRPVSFVCDDDAVRIQLTDPRTPLDGSCGELAQAPVLVPVGAHALLLSDDEGRELDLDLEVPADRDPDPVRIQSLREVPVSFEIVCADTDAPDTYVRIGDRVGRCPMQGTLPLGTYEVEARREGHDRWTREVVLTHRQPRIDVPALDTSSFWTAGSITTLAGAAVLLSAVAVDIAGQGDLDTLQALQDDLDDPEISLEQACESYATIEACKDDHAALKDTVSTNILVTRIVYGVGIAVAATGAGLWIWEALSSDVDELADQADASTGLDAPLVLPTMMPDGAGLNLRWTW